MSRTAPLSRPAEAVIQNLKKGQYLEALSNLEDLSNETSPDSLIEMLRGQALEGLGRLLEAEEAYWKALAAEKNRSASPFLLLGLLKDRMEDREKGLWVLEEGLRIFPENIDLLREAGILYGLIGHWHKALPHILKAYRLAPDLPENIMAFGPVVDRLELVDLYGEMYRAFSRLIEKSPQNPDVQDWYARSLERLEKSGQALKFYRGLLKKTPRDLRLLSHVARLARNTNETNRALDTYRLLMEETGESPDILCAMAETHKMAGKPLAALPLVRQALTMDPNNRETQALLGLILIDQGDPEKAEREFEDINFAPGLYQLGELYQRKKNPRKAVGAFSRGFTLRPDPYYATTLLKLLLSENEDFLFLETLAFLRILFPDTKVSPLLLKKAKDQFSTKRVRFENTLENPETLALSGLGEAFLPGGDPKLAYRHLEQAVTVDPISEVLFWTLAMFDENAKRWETAINWYQKVKHTSREPVTLLHRIAENLHNVNPTTDLWPLLKEFLALYGPRAGFYRVVASIAARSSDDIPKEILVRGMGEFPEDPSLFLMYRSLEPDRWKRLMTL